MSANEVKTNKEKFCWHPASQKCSSFVISLGLGSWFRSSGCRPLVEDYLGLVTGGRLESLAKVRKRLFNDNEEEQSW